jgi:hypothetical protein
MRSSAVFCHWKIQVVLVLTVFQLSSWFLVSLVCVSPYITYLICRLALVLSLNSGKIAISYRFTSLEITNYRGISIQPTLAKLLDRLMSNQLRTACKHVIDSVQHGFRQGKSTSTNLLIYQNYIVEALKNGHQVDSIYEDFSKAFDRVKHNILIYKLRLMNFDGIFVNWLDSFISDRSQLVKIGKYLSNPIEVKSGVPQGSHCRPLLLDLFINDIVLCVQFSKQLLFADDLIFKKISSIQDCFLLQRDLNSNERGACNDMHC